MGSDEDAGAVETAKKAKGEVKEVLGAVTGDRQVEAEGRVEQSPHNDESQSSAEQTVREEHHDVPGAAPGEEGPLGT